MTITLLPNLRSSRLRLSILVILSLLAVSTRLLPLAISSLPFNNDGITECVAASDILEAERFDSLGGYILSTAHSQLTPVYNVFLAFVSSLVGSDPFGTAQIAVAFFSAVTVTTGYLIALQLTKSVKGAIAAGLVLALYGTFLFLTGSKWKISLGVALLLLLFYAYMNRHDRKMFILEILLLATLPLVHHLVTVVAYLALAYLAVWSFAYAIRGEGIRRRHLADLAVVGMLSFAVYAYYYFGALERTSYINDGAGFAALIAIFGAFSLILIAVLRRRTKSRFTLAPVPAAVIFALFAWDYFNPIFSYTQGAPPYVFLLVLSTSALIALAWFGFERLHTIESPYRAIPFCALLPVLTLFVFALAMGTGVASHQIFYRSFDFAVISMALGVAASIAYFRPKPRLQAIAVFLLILVLLISLPFAYLTGPLEGVRHDTQTYEMDAINWVYTATGDDSTIRSDERISYLAKALHNYGKDPYLVLDLAAGYLPPAYSKYNIVLEEWTEIGVNAYPEGHVTVDETFLDGILLASNVFHVGGPSSNNILVFRLSSLGEAELGV